MHIVFIGPPGAGKGTQAQKLTNHLAIPHLSTGDLLRGLRDDNTPLGAEARKHLDAGELLPDSAVAGLVFKKLMMSGYSQGSLLDGFPRTIAQAVLLDEFLAKRSTRLHLAIKLYANDQVLMQRLSSRGRGDDTPATIKKRLAIYARETRPLLDYYRKCNLLHTIDGHGTTDDVFTRIEQCIDASRTNTNIDESA